MREKDNFEKPLMACCDSRQSNERRPQDMGHRKRKLQSSPGNDIYMI